MGITGIPPPYGCATLSVSMDDTENDTPRAGAAERDTARYTLTVEETSGIFAEAGVPRSIRSVQRYCKMGHLDCISVDTEISEKYLIDHNSVDRRIKELQQVDRIMRSTGDATRREPTRQNAAERDMSRRDEPENKRVEEFEKKLEDVESKLFKAEVRASSNEHIANELRIERREILALNNEQARIIGVFQARLQLAGSDISIPQLPNGKRQDDEQRQPNTHAAAEAEGDNLFSETDEPGVQ